MKQLADLPKEEVFDLIRDKLTVNGERLRFNMSGYDALDRDRELVRFGDGGYDEKPACFRTRLKGTCVLHNQKVLNQFASWGIYDTTHYLYLDFYKGGGHLYYRNWGCSVDHEVDFCGHSTTEIIYEVLERTVFNPYSAERRRD